MESLLQFLAVYLIWTFPAANNFSAASTASLIIAFWVWMDSYNLNCGFKMLLISSLYVTPSRSLRCIRIACFFSDGSPFFSIFACNGFSLQDSTIAFERNLLFLLPLFIYDFSASRLFVSLASKFPLGAYNSPLPTLSSIFWSSQNTFFRSDICWLPKGSSPFLSYTLWSCDLVSFGSPVMLLQVSAFP